MREQNGSALSETGLGVTLADIGVTGPDGDVIVRMTLNEDDNAATLIGITLLLTLPDDASLALRCATFTPSGVCGSMWSSNVTANFETYPAEALDPDNDGNIDSDGDGTLDAEENYQNNVVSSFQLFFQPAGQLFTNTPVDFTLDGALLQTPALGDRRIEPLHRAVGELRQLHPARRQPVRLHSWRNRSEAEIGDHRRALGRRHGPESDADTRTDDAGAHWRRTRRHGAPPPPS